MYIIPGACSSGDEHWGTHMARLKPLLPSYPSTNSPRVTWAIPLGREYTPPTVGGATKSHVKGYGCINLFVV